MSKKALIIDGHSILNRAFYGLPDLTNPEGLHTGGVYGFLNIMFKFLDEERPDLLVVSFDTHAPTFRHKIFTEYKATRHPMPEELRQQVPLLRSTLEDMDIKCIKIEGYESDDIIGTLAGSFEDKGISNVIITGDRDLLQLATDNTCIRIIKTLKTGTETMTYYASDVEAEYGVDTKGFVDIKALMGDSSDNIPGVPGVGKKTAEKLILEYGSLDNLYENIASLKVSKVKDNLVENKDKAELSRVLATINRNVPLEMDPDDAVIKDLFNDRSYKRFKELGFKKYLDRFEKRPDEKDDLPEMIIVNDPDDAENIIKDLKACSYAGFCHFESGDISVWAVAKEDKKVHLIYEDGPFSKGFMADKLADVRESGTIFSFVDMKKQITNTGDLFDIDHSDSFFDCSLASYLIDPLITEHDYDLISLSYLGMTVPGIKELLQKRSLYDELKNKSDDGAKVLSLRAYTAFRAYPVLKERLIKEDLQELFKTIEMPLLFVLKSMEDIGMGVDRDDLTAYGKSLEGRIEELEKLIYERAGEEFNILSPKQLGIILFEKMHMPVLKKTKSGYSTGVEILEKLRSEDPIIDLILEYRTLKKLQSTYAEGLLEFIGEDKRIHSSFNQMVTATGRISSKDPNLQNIPVRLELGKLIRKAFVPSENKIFIDADYSQIELRVMAHLSKDEGMCRAFREGMDIHTLTASQVFNVDPDEVTPLMRRNAKAVNFGIIYGISAYGLSQDVNIGRKEAQEYIEEYFHKFPGVKAFIDNSVEQAKKKGYSETMYKRKRPIPELSSSNFALRQFGERVAMNAPIQGTAADIIKIAMINVYKRLNKESSLSRLILQVHDELLIEADISEADKIEALLKEEMERAADLIIPLKVDISRGSNWYDAK